MSRERRSRLILIAGICGAVFVLFLGALGARPYMHASQKRAVAWRVEHTKEEALENGKYLLTETIKPDAVQP